MLPFQFLSGVSGPSAPTGVFNGTDDFKVPGSTAATRFIFVTEEGTVIAWNGSPAIVVNNSNKEAIYKGCTIAEFNGKHYLYVANFHSGDVEVYDSTFQRVRLRAGTFVDDDDQGPAFNGSSRSFAPFNVQAIGTNVYAQQDLTTSMMGCLALLFHTRRISRGRQP